jgi:hypothetical protein
MAAEFLNRALPFFGEDGFAVLRSKLVAFAGLGGVGGGAFLALVRCGVTRFRLAENGVFDPPDMNRQAAAFGTTMDRNKIEVYAELARSINPEVELELYPTGTSVKNIEDFLAGADLHVGVIDAEKGRDVKDITPGLLEKHALPMLTCGVFGFGALLVGHEPGSMMPEEFWALAAEKSGGRKLGLLPGLMAAHYAPAVMERIDAGAASGTLPTTAIGGMASNTLLAAEVLAYLLRGTTVMGREPVFAPRYAVVDFLEHRFIIGDVTE